MPWVILVMAPAAIVGAVLLYVSAPADPGAPIGARALALFVVYLAHAGIWTGLGLAVSARARSQATALVVLLALWFANAFVMPPLAISLEELDSLMSTLAVAIDVVTRDG